MLNVTDLDNSMGNWLIVMAEKPLRINRHNLEWLPIFGKMIQDRWAKDCDDVWSQWAYPPTEGEVTHMEGVARGIVDGHGIAVEYSWAYDRRMQCYELYVDYPTTFPADPDTEPSYVQ